MINPNRSFILIQEEFNQLFWSEEIKLFNLSELEKIPYDDIFMKYINKKNSSVKKNVNQKERSSPYP